MWSVGAWGLRPRKPRLGACANPRWLLSCGLSLATSTPPHIAPFSAPLRTETGRTRPSQRQAAARARRAKPGAKRRQGRAQRMPRQGKLRVGVGGAVSIKPHRTTPNIPPPNTRGSASPKGEARRECAGKPKRSARRAREDYGWGWAGGVTKPRPPPTPPPSRPAAQAERPRPQAPAAAPAPPT